MAEREDFRGGAADSESLTQLSDIAPENARDRISSKLFSGGCTVRSHWQWESVRINDEFLHGSDNRLFSFVRRQNPVMLFLMPKRATQALKTPVFGPDSLIFQQVAAARPRTSSWRTTSTENQPPPSASIWWLCRILLSSGLFFAPILSFQSSDSSKMPLVVCDKNQPVFNGYARNQEVSVIQRFSLLPQFGVYLCGSCDRLFGERQHSVFGCEFEKRSRLFAGITVFQTAHNFIIRYDADVHLPVPDKIGCEVIGDLGVISEEHRQDVRVNQ